jgi:hypothetical protein
MSVPIRSKSTFIPPYSLKPPSKLPSNSKRTDKISQLVDKIIGTPYFQSNLPGGSLFHPSPLLSSRYLQKIKKILSDHQMPSEAFLALLCSSAFQAANKFFYSSDELTRSEVSSLQELLNKSFDQKIGEEYQTFAEKIEGDPLFQKITIVGKDSAYTQLEKYRTQIQEILSHYAQASHPSPEKNPA